MVEMKKLTEKQSVDLPKDTSSTGASDDFDYDYDCKGMKEEFTATYYQNSLIKNAK